MLFNKVTKQDDDSAQEGEREEEEVQTEPDLEVELPGEDDDEDDGFGPCADDLDEEVAPAEDIAEDAETQVDVGKGRPSKSGCKKKRAHAGQASLAKVSVRDDQLSAIAPRKM